MTLAKRGRAYLGGEQDTALQEWYLYSAGFPPILPVGSRGTYRIDQRGSMPIIARCRYGPGIVDWRIPALMGGAFLSCKPHARSGMVNTRSSRCLLFTLRLHDETIVVQHRGQKDWSVLQANGCGGHGERQIMQAVFTRALHEEAYVQLRWQRDENISQTTC